VPGKIFGEGLIIHGDKMFLLTYRDKLVLEFSTSSWKEVRRHKFPYGEGWGITTDGCDLLVTTGSSYLFRFHINDAGDLTLVSKVLVTLPNGHSVRNLNEVEYITPKLWVNQFVTNNIYRVDPHTGRVELKIDIGKLHSWRGEETPNGLAYSTLLGERTLLVTGKLWPKMFALEMSPDDLCGGTAQGTDICPNAPASACWKRPASPTAGPVAAAASEEGSASPLAPTLKPDAKLALPPVSSAASPSAKDTFIAPTPLPTMLTVTSTIGSLALAAASFMAPFALWSTRRRLKTAGTHRSEPSCP